MTYMDKFEPAAQDVDYEAAPLVSIAISLRRIADALQPVMEISDPLTDPDYTEPSK